MTIDRGRLGWGVFFVTVGVVALAVRFGWVDPAWFEGIWRLWPLILVGIGVGLILRRTAFAALGDLIVGLTFGLMIGGVLATPINTGLSCLPSGAASGTPFEQSGTLTSDTAEIDITFPCAEVVIASSTGSGWTVTGTGIDAGTIAVDADDDALTVQRSGGPNFWGQGTAGRLDVALPTQPRLDLEIDASAGSVAATLSGTTIDSLDMSVNAGEATVLLAEASLESFSASVNAGSATLSLPATSWSGSASANAGSIAICVPAGAAARVTTSTALGSVDGGEGWNETEDGWATDAWIAAGEGAEMTLSVNLGSAALRVGGCE
jgi:hypothetical protein